MVILWGWVFLMSEVPLYTLNTEFEHCTLRPEPRTLNPKRECDGAAWGMRLHLSTRSLLRARMFGPPRVSTRSCSETDAPHLTHARQPCFFFFVTLEPRVE